MALEAVVYPQESFGYGCKEYYLIPANLSSSSGGANNYDLGFLQTEEDMSFIASNHNNNCHSESSTSPGMYNNNLDPNYSMLEEDCDVVDHNYLHSRQTLPAMQFSVVGTETICSGRRKRRRSRSCKNKEELENQRMTHIAVERNRRKQMNEYLAVIRSLMPPSYVQRGDQASIVGGAINYVKELEQHLQTLEAQKRIVGQSQQQQQQLDYGSSGAPFVDCFTFPQYSVHTNRTVVAADVTDATISCDSPPIVAKEKQPALGDIEVTMAESHANLKILSKRRPRQLLKIVAGLQCLWLSVLHLNVTTVDQMVLYSLSVKLEEGCQLSTADEIADAANQLLGKIQEEAATS